MGLLELQIMLENWSKDRPLVRQNNTLETVQSLLRQEMDEFEQSPDPTELADIIIYALSIGNLMGLDMEAEIREKIAFNNARFSSDLFQTGSYDDAILQGKKIEKDYLKRDFYNIPR